MLIERWRRPSMLSSMCQDVARLQFDSSSEKDSLCGTVMMGLNWKCLDQCHGVRSHGKISSQGWRKIVVQSKFDPWVYILVFAECDLYKFVWESLPTEAGLCRHPYWSVVAQATAKFRPRTAQGLFSNERTWHQELDCHWSYCPNERKVEQAAYQHAPICAITCQHGPTLQFVSCAEKDSLWWNSHDGPEPKTLGSMPWCSFPWHKLLPKLVQKICCIDLGFAEGNYCRFA